MSRDPIKPHHMSGRDIIQRLLALMYQRRRSNGLKRFQCRLTIRAYTDVFLRSILRLNLTDTGKDSIYLSLEYCCVSTPGKAVLLRMGVQVSSISAFLLSRHVKTCYRKVMYKVTTSVTTAVFLNPCCSLHE